MTFFAFAFKIEYCIYVELLRFQNQFYFPVGISFNTEHFSFLDDTVETWREGEGER